MSSCVLCIKDFKLVLRIGVESWERASTQDILLSISIIPSEVLKGGVSDDISDVIDYHQLLMHLKQLEDKEYKLIERLASDAFSLITEYLNNKNSIKSTYNVEVSIKKHPKIEGLEGFVEYKLKGEV